MNWKMKEIDRVFLLQSYGDKKKLLTDLNSTLNKYNESLKKNPNIEGLRRKIILKKLIFKYQNKLWKQKKT